MKQHEPVNHHVLARSCAH